MSALPPLKRPWLVAVWPGMGSVAISAGYYLMAKLGMHALAELSARELFDVEHVEVHGGILKLGSLPRSRFFVGSDPAWEHDIVVFIGEAQPPIGKYAFCQRLIEYAKELGVERVITFAAMATQMHPSENSRVFAAATDDEILGRLREKKLAILEEGNISGLNGVLLGIAVEQGLRGACLLGEMPHIFAQLPFPKASLEVVRVFAELAGIEIDLAELKVQADAMDRRLGELLSRVEQAIEEQTSTDEAEEEEYPIPPLDEGLPPEDRERIDQLFDQAAHDRSKAYELKQELDRLEVFREYEDRFLDLFKKQG